MNRSLNQIIPYTKLTCWDNYGQTNSLSRFIESFLLQKFFKFSAPKDDHDKFKFLNQDGK